MQQFSLKTSVLEKVSKIIPLIAVLLVPIFFLPITSEFYSFNKLALIIISTMILLVIWGLKTIKGEKLEIIKSSVDKPLIAFAVAMLISTIFSLSKTDSVFGQQGRWLGLASFLVMMAYFYLSTPAFRDQKVVKLALNALVLASTISSLISILSYYNVFISGSPFYRFQNFSLTGSIKDAILIAALSVVVSVALSMYEETALTKTGLVLASAINFYFVAITGTVLGWVLLAIGLTAIFFFIKPSVRDNNRNLTIIQFVGIFAPILALVLIPTTRKILVDTNYIGEMSLPVRESWAISTSTIRDYPWLATGPSTFHLNFSRYKPLSMNRTIYWGNTFDKPYNELFNVLSTMGLVGTATGILLSICIIFLVFKSTKSSDNNMVAVSGLLLLMVTVSFLLNHATILNVFLLFSSLSILIGSNVSSDPNSSLAKPISLEVTGLASISSPEDQTVITGSYTKYLLAIPAFVLAAYLGYSSVRVYTGEYYMRKSLNAISDNRIADAYKYQISALGFNPNRDTYYDSFAKVNMTVAMALASKDPQELTDKDRQDIQSLIQQALQNSRMATEQVGPLNVSNWITRAQIYQNLVNVAQNAYEWSISAYNTAIQLDPVNPRLRLDLGGVYFTGKDYLSAANQFRQAVTLKPDYANARYNFALSLVALGEYAQAKNELEITKLLLPEDSEDRKVLDNEIKNVAAMIKPAQEEKPTVEELTGVENATENQEPLTNVTEQQPTEIDPNVLPTTEPTQPVQQVEPQTINTETTQPANVIQPTDNQPAQR